MKVVDQDRLLISDFRGDNAFNSLGNIVGNPNTELLFIDFETGDVLAKAGGFAHRSKFIDYAPQLARTGTWAA